jgi:hypothetical protein
MGAPSSGHHDPRSDRDVSWLLCGVAVLVLASPVRHLWADGRAPWYLPFALWLSLIVLARLLARGRAP